MNGRESTETRLSGALREISAHAPTAPAIESDVTRAEPGIPHRLGPRPGWLRPTLAAAAVAVIVGGAGTVVAARNIDATGRQDKTMVNGPAEPGGTTPPSEVSESPAGSQSAVDNVAVRLTAFELALGYGRVSVDYDNAAVTVLWQGEPPMEVESLAASDPNDVDVVLKQVPYSQAELVQAGRRLLNAPRNKVGGAIFAVTFPNEGMTGLVVEVVKLWSGSSAPLDRVAQVPVSVRLVDEAPQPLGDE